MHTAPDRWLTDGPAKADCTIALAHGAGLPMDSPFMEHIACGLAENGYRVVRFEFPYMADRRTHGTKKPPNREPVLRETWLEVIRSLGPERLVISGKSMGGRIASLVAEEAQVMGLVALGYPFHPVGKPDRLRVEHLAHITTPTLILQGERDPFGKPEEVATYALGPQVRVEWIADGEHSFKPRKASGLTTEQNWDTAVQHFAQFCRALTEGST